MLSYFKKTIIKLITSVISRTLLYVTINNVLLTVHYYKRNAISFFSIMYCKAVYYCIVSIVMYCEGGLLFNKNKSVNKEIRK